MKSTSDTLKFEIIEHTALLTLDNPGANTWDTESLPALAELIRELNDNKRIYALVLTGEGDKFFSAGADLNLFADGDPDQARRMAEFFGQGFECLANFRGVSVAAINGYAMGGGLEACLACDIRVAESHAQMALPEPRVGLLPCAGGTQRLAWLVGEGWAKQMILCGERVDAEKALQIGLVQERVGRGESRARALALAAQVAEQSPLAVAAGKALIHRARDSAMTPALPQERERFVALFTTDDQREGVRAFLEKREPRWRNA